VALETAAKLSLNFQQLQELYGPVLDQLDDSLALIPILWTGSLDPAQ
jgi:hypothetical protein